MGTADQAAATGRQGPRPLALHLAMANLGWATSQLAWPLSRNGSLPWKPALAERADALGKSLAQVPPDAFAAALRRAISAEQRTLLSGIEAYRAHPYRRSLADPPCLWREGSSRLLDFRTGARAPVVLVVPSLINRATVLDLMPGRSLMRWLADQGIAPFLLDWGRPDGTERAFTLSDYVAGRLARALDQVLAQCERPPVLVGYCMGGLLALALALRRQDRLAGLALLATPWDFAAGQSAQSRAAIEATAGLWPLVERLGEMPVDIIQGLFASLDPLLTQRKFMAFARLDPASERAQAFVALEDWLNDGVPLAAPVARECLEGWYRDNLTARGRWRIDGRVVDPGALDLPSLCVIPSRDRIVPPASARALAKALPDPTCLTPTLGHIGMVVGGRAPEALWRPLKDWILARATG